MQIKTPSGLLYINNNDDRATKIRKGHAHRFENDVLIVEDEITGIDFDNLLKKLDSHTASTVAIQELLAHLLRIHLESGKL